MSVAGELTNESGGAECPRAVPLPLLVCVLLLCPRPALSLDLDGPQTVSTSERCSGQDRSAVVAFEDENLEVAVRAALSVGEDADITCDLASSLTSLEAADRDIESLEGIQHLVGLEELNLWGNEVTDISQLAGLTRLNRLVLGANSVQDVRPLAALTNLTVLQLRENRIEDLGPLSRLTSLVDLDISHNEISDISALRGMTRLAALRVYFNPLTDIGAMRGMTELTELHVHDLPDLSTLQPLVENDGLGRGDIVIVFGSNVCSEVGPLQDKGVRVSGCTLESLWHYRWVMLLSVVLLGFGGVLLRRRNQRQWAAWRAEASRAGNVDGAI